MEPNVKIVIVFGLAGVVGHHVASHATMEVRKQGDDQLLSSNLDMDDNALGVPMKEIPASLNVVVEKFTRKTNVVYSFGTINVPKSQYYMYNKISGM